MRISIVALVVFVLGPLATAQNWLKTPIVHADWPGHVRLAGDVDGDGDVDLIPFDGFPSQGIWTSFQALLNDGDGQFTNGSSMSLPSDCGQHVLYADVNGDGFKDVIVSTLSTNPLGAGLLVFPGLAGGAFGPSTHSSLAGNVVQLRAGNANNDGIDDIAVIHFESGASSWHARWIPGSASSTYTPLPGLLLSLSLYVDGLAVLDLNADGVDDFAISHDSSIQFSYTVGGAPTSGGPSFPVLSDFQTFLVPGDIDGDGDLDLVAASSTGFTTLSVTRLRNQGGGVWNSMGAQNFPNTDTGPIFLGDWNGDGAPDLLLREYGFSGGGYGFYKNNGAGVFAHRYTRDTQLSQEAEGAGCFDLNGDGLLDFADSNAIFFGDGTFKDFLGTPGQSYHRIRDWEDDGDIDLPLEVGQIRKNDGRGGFTTTSLSWPTPGVADHIFSSELFLEDLDGNGLFDGLVAHFVLMFPLTYQFIDMRRFEDTGAGAFVDRGRAAPSGVQMIGVPLPDDVDGDGDVDLINAEGIWLNSGAQFFAAPVGGPFNGYAPILKGDIDGDGDNDFIANYVGGTQSLALLRRTGPATFNVELLYAPTTAFTLINAPVLADLDDDGDLDVAVDKGPSGTTVTIYENVGGVFVQSSVLPIIGSLGSTALAAGDLDGDGKTDLALSYSTRVRIYRRTGPGFTYEAAREHVAGIGRARALVDIDNDGDLDLIGGSTIFNPRVDGSSAGFSRQYGLGLAGSAGRRPVLGATGPIRPGSSPSLRIREGLGGAPALLALGLSEANIPNYGGLPGLTLYIDPIVTFLPLDLGGVAGQPGAGYFDLGFSPPPGLGGARVFLQALIRDPGAPNRISTTNGIEVLIGF